MPGNHPYRPYKVMPLVPKGDEKCIDCGLCVRLCPVQAISMQHPCQTDENLCISCMRCTKYCPTGARHLAKEELTLASQAIKKKCTGEKTNELFID